MTLVELMVYMVMLFLVMGLAYQARELFVEGVYKEANQSTVVLDVSLALDRLRSEVAQSDIPVRISNSAQPSGAPSGSDSSNCIEMSRKVSGLSTVYSVYVRWDDESKGFRLHLKSGQNCSSAPSGPTDGSFSSPIFRSHSDEFFTAVGAAEDGRYRELNFNYQAEVGAGRLAAGVGETSIRLSTSLVTPQECRVASSDKSWFTDYGTKKIRTVIVSFTLNLDSTSDRLQLLGSHSDVSATSFNDLGILHLYAKDGRTVEEWLELLSDVEYFRAPGASAVSQSTPPRRITFSLGEGLPYNVAGLPSGHFYLAVKLDSATNFAGSDDLAKGFCYPSFQDDSNYLGRGAKGASSSCNVGNHRRLTGHLVTLTTEGEDDFLRRKVLKMVYPFALQTSGAFVSADVAPSSGELWLGGRYGRREGHWNGSSYTSTSAEGYYWVRGFELSREVNNSTANRFADSNRVRLSGVAAGKYWESIETGYLPNPLNLGTPLFYSIASGGNSKYWGAKAATSTLGLLAVEFGDNKNSTGGNTSTTDEDVLNANIRLKKDVTIIPFEFFRACRKN